MDLFLGRLTPPVGEFVILTKPNRFEATTIRIVIPGNNFVRIKIFLLISLLGSTWLFTPGLHAAERLYKVIDQDGKVSYQDLPPIDAKSTVLKKFFESRTFGVDRGT